MNPESTIAELGLGEWVPPGIFDDQLSVWFTDPEVDNAFPDSGLDVFASVDSGSFWFDHRNAMISNAVRRYGGDATFVEVGSGSGVVAERLTRDGLRVVAVEPIRAGAAHAATRGVALSVCGDLASLGLPSASIDQLGAFDVIEHLEHPFELLEECRRVLRSGGLLFLTVPAHQWLWSDFDEWNGHFRRYSLRRLESEVASAGFRRVLATYFFMPLMIPAIFSRLLADRLRSKRTKDEIEEKLASDLAPRSPLVGPALRLVHSPEAKLLGRAPIPTGTSVLLVAAAE